MERNERKKRRERRERRERRKHIERRERRAYVWPPLAVGDRAIFWRLVWFQVDVAGTPVAPTVPHRDGVVEGDRVVSTASEDISSAQPETKSGSSDAKLHGRPAQEKAQKEKEEAE